MGNVALLIVESSKMDGNFILPRTHGIGHFVRPVANYCQGTRPSPNRYPAAAEHIIGFTHEKAVTLAFVDKSNMCIDLVESICLCTQP